jgi:hypothetical protein
MDFAVVGADRTSAYADSPSPTQATSVWIDFAYVGMERKLKLIGTITAQGLTVTLLS